MLAQGHRGRSYSFGYPACPNLADRKQLLALLGAEEMGITLSEEDQIDPEQSTPAIVVYHPGEIFLGVTFPAVSEIFSSAPPNSSLPRA
jgi:5-methyltetrahydrofolate--homocysteine methyltransferase